MEKVLFLVAFLVAYTIQAITGFAGNMLAMPIGTSLLGLNETIALLNVAGVLACGGLAIINYKHINWKELGKILAVLTVFMFVGIWLDTIIPLPMLLRIYGAIVIVVGIKGLFFPTKAELPEWVLWIILIVSGLIQGMFVSGGAFLVIYAVQKIKDKQQFRITLSATWAVLNFIYAVVAFQAGYFTGEVNFLVLCMLPLIVIATVLGSYLQKRIPQEAFVKFVNALLVVIGIILLITA